MLRRWRHGYVLAAAMVIAAVAFVVISLPLRSLAADPIPGATTSADAVQWSVVPAGADGPDGRRWVESAVKPGEVITEHMAVTNLGRSALTFGLSAADGYFTDTGRFAMRTADAASVDAGLWISVPQSVDIPAGQTAIVAFTVTVPDNATPGDHAGAVAASVFSQGSTAEGTNVGVESRVGFRVMLSVAGAVTPDLDISALSARYVTNLNPFQPGSVVVDYDVQNSGNVWLMAAATAAAQGNSVSADGVEMLQGEGHQATVAVTRIWPLGAVDVTVTASGAPQADGAEPVTVTKSMTVWAVPWPQLFALIALVLIIVLIVLVRKSTQRRMQRRLDEARAEGARAATGE